MPCFAGKAQFQTEAVVKLCSDIGGQWQLSLVEQRKPAPVTNIIDPSMFAAKDEDKE